MLRHHGHPEFGAGRGGAAAAPGAFAFALFAAGRLSAPDCSPCRCSQALRLAVAETFRWPIGLGLTLAEARGFYAVLHRGGRGWMLIDLSGIDSMKALVWAAIVNGVSLPFRS